MSQREIQTRIWQCAAGLALALALPSPAAAGDGIGPEIPQALKGEQCVEPTEVMRRDHMDMLMHQRDETVHEGIRTEKHSLDECLECHVPPESEKVVRADSPEHFCSSCHSYAAVQIDCFQCHAEQPEGDDANAQFHRIGGHPGLPERSGEALGGDVLDVLAAEDLAPQEVSR